MNIVVAGKVTREEDSGQRTEEVLHPRVRR